MNRNERIGWLILAAVGLIVGVLLGDPFNGELKTVEIPVPITVPAAPSEPYCDLASGAKIFPETGIIEFHPECPQPAPQHAAPGTGPTTGPNGEPHE